MSTMSLFDTLPIDIINQIYEMNPEHRERFNILKDELQLKGVKARVKYLTILFGYMHNLRSFTSLVIEHIPDYDHVMNILNKCKCCKRHMSRRPITVNNPLDYDQLINMNNPGDFAINRCGCDCRHICRELFHAYGSIHRYYNEGQNDDDYHDDHSDY